MSELPILPFKVDAFLADTTDMIAEHLRIQHKPPGCPVVYAGVFAALRAHSGPEWPASTCLRDV
jgi:hypothetical protein